MSDSEEIWKPIPEYEDRYEVSNKGRVRSVDRTVTDSLGRTRQLKGKVLRQNYMGIGYRCVALHKNGNQKTHAVHSLVASAFLEDPPGPIGVNSGEYQVNHLDGDKTNNSAENLEWCTLEENHNHAWENGHHDRGQNRPFSKLTPQKVKEARRKYRDISLSFAQLGERYGVAMETIRQAIRGETWAHVEDPPPVTD